MAKKKTEINDIIKCPHCGRRGTVIRVFDEDKISVLHKVEKDQEVISQATGFLITCHVATDVCWSDGRKVRPAPAEEGDYL